jgi:hypothetical protein
MVERLEAVEDHEHDTARRHMTTMRRIREGVNDAYPTFRAIT